VLGDDAGGEPAHRVQQLHAHLSDRSSPSPSGKTDECSEQHVGGPLDVVDDHLSHPERSVDVALEDLLQRARFSLGETSPRRRFTACVFGGTSAVEAGQHLHGERS